MRTRIHQEIFFYACLLLAFFIPILPAVLPAIILCISANWLISGVYLKTFGTMLNERWRFLTLSFALLYLVYVLGMLYSINRANGWFDLEVKLSLLIFPVVFSTSDLSIFSLKGKNLVFNTFVAGCLVGALMLLVRAWYVSAGNETTSTFYYTALSWFFHPGYLAMYYTFAIWILIYRLTDRFSELPGYQDYFLILLILFLEAMLFLLSSKAGLLVLVFLQFMFLVLLAVRKVKPVRLILVALVMMGIFFGFSWMFPYAFGRISKAGSVITSSREARTDLNDGTVERIAIWKVSAVLVRENLLFGVGTGDVKTTLQQAYKNNNLEPVARKMLNAHNQYLQTFIAIGITGFLILSLSLFFPGLRSFLTRDYLYLGFILIFGINLLVESMLETQAGVIFYAFFNMLLFSKNIFRQ